LLRQKPAWKVLVSGGGAAWERAAVFVLGVVLLAGAGFDLLFADMVRDVKA
jgi:hypothetical protein